MIKTTVLLGLLSMAALPASAAETQYIGGLTILSQTGTCPEGNQVGNNYLARYRPRNIEQNGPHSDLNIFRQSSALGHRLFNASFTSSLQKVQATRIAGGSGTDTLAQSKTFIKFTTQTPVAANTKFVNVQGSIQGFDGQPACTVNFLMSGALRTDF